MNAASHDINSWLLVYTREEPTFSPKSLKKTGTTSGAGFQIFIREFRAF